MEVRPSDSNYSSLGPSSASSVSAQGDDDLFGAAEVISETAKSVGLGKVQASQVQSRATAVQAQETSSKASELDVKSAKEKELAAADPGMSKISLPPLEMNADGSPAFAYTLLRMASRSVKNNLESRTPIDPKNLIMSPCSSDPESLKEAQAIRLRDGTVLVIPDTEAAKAWEENPGIGVQVYDERRGRLHRPAPIARVATRQEVQTAREYYSRAILFYELLIIKEIEKRRREEELAQKSRDQERQDKAHRADEQRRTHFFAELAKERAELEELSLEQVIEAGRELEQRLANQHHFPSHYKSRFSDLEAAFQKEFSLFPIRGETTTRLKEQMTFFHPQKEPSQLRDHNYRELTPPINGTKRDDKG